MTIEEYFYLDHYLEHYAIIFGKNTEQISFEEGKGKVEYFYNKAQPFDSWSKPTFRIDEPKPFA